MVASSRTQSPYSQDNFVNYSSVASGNNTGVLGGFDSAAQIRARLLVNAIAGSLPHLAVIIEDTFDDPSGASVYWASIGAFPTFGPTLVAATVAYVNIAGPFGKNIRVRHEVGVGSGGTLPAWGFKVDIITRSGPNS